MVKRPVGTELPGSTCHLKRTSRLRGKPHGEVNHGYSSQVFWPPLFECITVIQQPAILDHRLSLWAPALQYFLEGLQQEGITPKPAFVLFGGLRLFCKVLLLSPIIESHYLSPLFLTHSDLFGLSVSFGFDMRIMHVLFHCAKLTLHIQVFACSFCEAFFPLFSSSDLFWLLFSLYRHTPVSTGNRFPGPPWIPETTNKCRILPCPTLSKKIFSGPK